MYYFFSLQLSKKYKYRDKGQITLNYLSYWLKHSKHFIESRNRIKHKYFCYD